MSRILIASGGTGGHIFPAIVFGRDRQQKGDVVSWLCGSRKLEAEIYHSSGIEPVILPLSGSPMGTRSPVKIISRIIDVFRSISRTAKYIRGFKPDEVYLFGGYISFAPLIVAKVRGIPVKGINFVTPATFTNIGNITEAVKPSASDFVNGVLALRYM